jgi:hypothetical protein
MTQDTAQNTQYTAHSSRCAAGFDDVFTHLYMCLLLVPLRHAAKVIAGQQVYVVEPRLPQALEVGQAM